MSTQGMPLSMVLTVVELTGDKLLLVEQNKAKQSKESDNS